VRDARSLTEKARSLEVNYQRTYVLNLIEEQARIGNKQVVILNPFIKLYKEDYEFFCKLGFNVEEETITPTKNGMMYKKFAIIWW
jgi:hypothetical protein